MSKEKDEFVVKERILGGADHVMPFSKMRIEMQAQVRFRGRRIFIPPEFASRFLVHNITVGYNSQMVSATPIPGEFFAELQEGRGERGIELDMERAEVGMTIALEVENITDRSSPFHAAIAGLEG